MESYHGLILTPRDAMILLEAARVGMIPKTTRRLSEIERSKLIQNGAIFIWDEMESGMKRWTDGKSWSASRVSGSFLIYKEMENTKSFTFYSNLLSSLTNEESYRYKNNGLIKQSFSITLNNNLKLHLISYINHSYLKKNFNYSQLQQLQQEQLEVLQRPTEDLVFKNLKFDPSLYPETILTYQDTVTDFQQVENSMKSENSSNSSSIQHSTSTPNSSISSSNTPLLSQQHAQQLQYLQQQQQQQLRYQSNNYRMQSTMMNVNDSISSPRLMGPVQNANRLPPLFQEYGNNSSNQDHHLQQLQQQQRSSLLILQQQQQLQHYQPILNTNIPLHHKEDGMYLNMLDRTFSS